MTFYFQMQFVKIHYSSNKKNAIKCVLKGAIISKASERLGSLKNPEKKKKTNSLNEIS